jgi:hypothetical protein
MLPSLKRTPVLPIDPKDASALLLAVLRGDIPVIAGRDAMDALTRRNRELRNGGPEAIKDALADQLTLLEVAWLRFLGEGCERGTPDQKRALMATALRCQQAFVATAGALHRLNEESRDAAAIEAE